MGALRQSLLLLTVVVHAVLVLVGGQVDTGGAPLPTSSAPLPTDGQQRGEAEGAGPPWECPRPGRFPNPADPSCRTYLTCALVPGGSSNGSRVLAPARQDECWPGALFSGRYQRCITGTDCATLEDFYAIEYECGECGKYVLESSPDCRHFVNCLKTRDPGVFVPIRQRCPDERPLFSPPAHACVPEDEYECGGGGPPPPLPSLLSMPPPVTPAGTTTTTQATTTTVTPVTPVTTVTRLPATGHYLSDLVCLGVGRFPDESVPHCRGYRLCEGDGQGAAAAAAPQLVSRSFLCDPGTVFSEYERRCVPATSYQCPDDGTTTVATVPEAFRCVTVGRFPDRGSHGVGGCRRFYRCQRASDGSLEPPILERCPPGTIFSWLTTRCVPPAEYECPVVGVPSGEPPSPAPAPPDSRCARSGRFANDADATCRTYYICTRDPAGSWALVLIRCPAGTVFSRAVDHCVGSETSPLLVGGLPCQLPVQCGADRGDGEETGSADCPTESETEPRRATSPVAEPAGAGAGSGDGAPWLTWSATEPLTADASATLDVDGGDLVLSTSALRPTYSPPEYPCTATGRFADINSVDCRSYFLCKLLDPPTNHPLPHPAGGHHSKQHQQILVSVHMTCPDGMLFSRNTNKCVISNRHVC